MADIQLIVGLGNPGPQYQHTRHNAGSWFVQQLAANHHIPLKLDPKFSGLVGRGTFAEKDIRLLVPTTFMNNSGRAVAALSHFYRIPPENILIAFDELDLAAGTAKFKQGGSSTQNGIRDIVSSLGNQQQFLRLRIGIGHPGNRAKVTGYVLGKAPPAEQHKMDAAIDEALHCTQILCRENLATAMQRLHSFKAE